MKRIIYNKLVRDRIPEIIQNAGKISAVEELMPNEYSKLLRAKLVEEALEVQDSSDENLILELADIQEILDTIRELHGISFEEVLKSQVQRRLDRGGFAKRIKLLWVEE